MNQSAIYDEEISTHGSHYDIAVLPNCQCTNVKHSTAEMQGLIIMEIRCNGLCHKVTSNDFLNTEIRLIRRIKSQSGNKRAGLT